MLSIHARPAHNPGKKSTPNCESVPPHSSGMAALTVVQRPAGIELGAFVLPDAVAEDHMYVVPVYGDPGIGARSPRS